MIKHLSPTNHRQDHFVQEMVLILNYEELAKRNNSVTAR